MSIDICSIWSYNDMVVSGEIGKRQAMYLSVFSEHGKPLTRRQADKLVGENFEVSEFNKWDGRRISELSKMGFVRKYDIVECEFTKRLVNRWIYTGNKEALSSKIEYVCCTKCKGTGTVKKKVFFKPMQESI